MHKTVVLFYFHVSKMFRAFLGQLKHCPSTAWKKARAISKLALCRRELEFPLAGIKYQLHIAEPPAASAASGRHFSSRSQNAIIIIRYTSKVFAFVARKKWRCEQDAKAQT